VKNILLHIICILLLALPLSAQRKGSTFTASDDKNAIHKNEWSIGARLHSNGLSAFYERVWIKSTWKSNILQVNYFQYKDLKEQRQKSIYFINGTQKRFIYGKQNNFFSVNALFGQRKVLADRADVKGVKVSMTYLGGVSLGFLKPYYLEFIRQTGDGFDTFVEPYTGENDSIFLDNSNQSRIVGRGGIQYGFGEMVPIPGAHGKFGFHFDWGKNQNLVSALELGVQLDIYYRNIPIMITERNRPFIMNVYLAFQLGKRW
jgi:hypothetical protein